ncbi:hypothetical protein SAMN05216327_109245 [Dyadobacter sp. SG02]|uniref:hypothetical protein n=1 Tax=Dyadobacter sp. SG02 TaxID=1855291 RepID=UPI0008AE2587|nr:hypothetical protein [Dyadobacter sp. SG02]SEJ39754.1 hypothetical protein SAMN05216327_109245 [Dyadobacter sp. SG02]
MMILLDINPLSKPVAISEMLILLILAAVIGWLIGDRISKSKARGLREKLSEREADLDECRTKSRNTVIQPAHAALNAVTPDNLKLIEGIGPKIEELLNKHGIYTFGQLADTAPSWIVTILHLAGSRFQMHDPSTWPQQSKLARDGKWDELNELQDSLDGGRIESE